MDLEALIETAEYLQIDPVDLATVISYETGGTFDPMQPGPTTQWGQHRGLIQFGGPQARRRDDGQGLVELGQLWFSGALG